MLKLIKKFFGLYANPGAIGPDVYVSPDSLADIWRVRNVRFPKSAIPVKPCKPGRVSIWGGGAAHVGTVERGC